MVHSDVSDKKLEKSAKNRAIGAPTKVVVRRLPPNFTLQTFREQVSPLPKHNYIYCAEADAEDNIDCFSRVYINFVRAEDVSWFKKKYDNYVFVGANGAKYPAVVEYAPFQRVPKIYSSNDLKSNSIEVCAYYKQFMDSLNKGKKEAQRVDFNFKIESKPNIESTTPLLKYICEKKGEKNRNEKDQAKQKGVNRRRNGDNSLVFVNSNSKKGYRNPNLRKEAKNKLNNKQNVDYS